MATDEHDDYCLKQYRYLYSPDILCGKVALITGGGSGIGFRIAEIFMRHKCDIAIASRKISKLKEVRNVLHVKGICTLSFSLDTGIVCGCQTFMYEQSMNTTFLDQSSLVALQSAARLTKETGQQCLPLQMDVRKV